MDLNQLHTGIIVINKANFRPELFNPAAQKIFGWDYVTIQENFSKLDSLSSALKSFTKFLSDLQAGNYDAELNKSSRVKRIELLINSQHYNIYISLLNAGSLLEKLPDARLANPEKPELTKASMRISSGERNNADGTLQAGSKYLLEFSPIVYQDMKQSTHELKRPIQNIKILVETLMLGAKNDKAKCDEYLEKLNHEADRLGTLVSDMLMLSYVINGTIELNITDFMLRPKIAKLLESAESKAKAHKINLSNQIPDDVSLNADIRLFEHLLANIIDNAIKYNKEHGQVIISSDGHSITVTDTGLGIKESDLDKIFEEFYRTKETQNIQGSGLGLTIVKAITELHGWQITASSKLNEGTSFKILTDNQNL